MKKLLILCMTTTLLLQAQTFELAPNGAAFIKGQNFIKAMQPILWDKSWTNTTVDTKIPADPSLSSVNVSLHSVGSPDACASTPAIPNPS